jgi:hypothetical protein
MYTTVQACITAPDGVGDITVDTDHHITGHRHHIGLRQPADHRVADLLVVDLLAAVVVPDLHPCLPEDSQRQAKQNLFFVIFMKGRGVNQEHCLESAPYFYVFIF